MLGLGVGDAFKAYPVSALQSTRVVNEGIGVTGVVVIASSFSEAARTFERGERRFAAAGDDSTGFEMTRSLVDSASVVWEVTEDYLVRLADPAQKLARLPSHMSFWFGWYQFHPDTEMYASNGG